MSDKLAWIALGAAVVANVTANLSLHRAVTVVDARLSLKTALDLLTTPWSWLGGASCLVLIIAYLMAIRTLPLSVSYATVTTLAMALLLAVGVLSGTESLTLARGAGLALVMAGVALLTLSV